MTLPAYESYSRQTRPAALRLINPSRLPGVIAAGVDFDNLHRPCPEWTGSLLIGKSLGWRDTSSLVSRNQTGD
jgi:hypothetical protein